MIQHNLANVPERIVKKLMYANAARVYQLDESHLGTVKAELQAA